MDLLTAQQIMLSRLVTQWGTTTAVLVLPNEAAPEPALGIAYARASLVGVTDEQVTIGGPGSRRFERRNMLVVRCCVPRDSGVSTMSTLRKQVTDIFEGFKSDELWVIGITPRTVIDDGLSMAVDCEVAFNFHEKK